MDEVNRALGHQGSFEHRQCRGNTNTTTDQHQRLVTGGQCELSGRREQLNDVAYLQLVMQEVGHNTTRLTLDADAVAPHLRQCRQ